MPNLLDLTGKQFNDLTVITRSKRNPDKGGNVFWDCKCVCGKIITIRSPSLRTGNTKSCGCKQYTDRSMLFGSKSGVWTGCGELSGDQWNHIVRQANQRKFLLGVDIQFLWQLFLKQNKKCALSGEPINFDIPGKGRSSRNASLDRIDSKRGYTKDNVQWVHKDVNMMKWKLNQERFKYLCQKIAKHALTTKL